MYELIKVSENCYYIQSPAKIGVIVTGENGVCLIDSGNDKDAGKKIKKILDANGWKLKSIYNTHSHADHIGGNAYLQKQTGCKIYAPGIEEDFTKHTVLEPAFLYGANPPKELKHKFLMAQESEVLPLNKDSLSKGMELIELPGHSWDMAGFRTSDGIVYLADCLSSEETLKKYQVSFLVDVGAYIETLKKVSEMEAKLFIPAHAEPVKDIRGLAKLNIDKVMEIADVIEKICSKPRSFDEILKNLFEHYVLTMTFEQNALVGSTVKSYLTWLKEQGRLKAEINDNMLVWTNIGNASEKTTMCGDNGAAAFENAIGSETDRGVSNGTLPGSLSDRLRQQLTFSLEIDKEKNILRQTHLSGYIRQENDAEHAWHMAIMAYLLREYSNEEVDIGKVILMCLIHDIVEIDAGDTYAYDDAGLKTQKAREDAAKERIFSLLPADQKEELIAIFDEFEDYSTAESKYAHAMDNLQPLILNNINGGRDWREHKVTDKKVYGRQSKTKLGSEKLFEVIDEIIKNNIEKGNIKHDNL